MRAAHKPSVRWRTAALALVTDLAVVVVFATIGRRSHAEGVTATGVVATAWPFAAGTAVGWAAVAWTAFGGWRVPTSVLATGVPVWVATVAGGMVLRRVTGEDTAPAFVVVASVVLGMLLLGWRVVARRWLFP